MTDTKAMPVGVRVKDMCWEAPDQVSWLGHGFSGCDYYIAYQNGSWWLPGDSEEADEFPTADAAKAAAQSDFASRILSTIEAGPGEKAPDNLPYDHPDCRYYNDGKGKPARYPNGMTSEQWATGPARASAIRAADLPED